MKFAQKWGSSTNIIQNNLQWKTKQPTAVIHITSKLNTQCKMDLLWTKKHSTHKEEILHASMTLNLIAPSGKRQQRLHLRMVKIKFRMRLSKIERPKRFYIAKQSLVRTKAKLYVTIVKKKPEYLHIWNLKVCWRKRTLFCWNRSRKTYKRGKVRVKKRENQCKFCTLD